MALRYRALLERAHGTSERKSRFCRMMDVRYLKTFVALAESGNVTRTAEHLDYAPSSVAAHVHALEDEVGVTLIERSGRGITLTEAGRAFVPHAKRIVDAERHAIAVARSARPSTTVTVGSAASFSAHILPRVIARVRASRPDVSISIRGGQCREILDAMRNGDVDVTFTVDRRHVADRMRNDTFASEALWMVPILTVVSPQHRLAGLDRVDVSALQGETLLDSEPGCCYREAFAACLEDAGVEVGTRFDFDSFEPIVRLALDGIGVALVPQFVVADKLAAGTLVELPLRAPGDFAIIAMWRRGAANDALELILSATRAEAAQLAPLLPVSA